MKTKTPRCLPHNPGVLDLVQRKREWSSTLTPNEIKLGFQGWHERGYLPHRDQPGLVQFVTFRLADAFPNGLRSEWEALLKIADDRRRQIQLEAYLDKGRGECLLRRPNIAAMIEDSLLYRNGQDYELRAWSIMPNHVHVLFKTQGMPMSEVVGAWKGFLAKKANRALGRHGRLWQDDYWDTFMRDEQHERRACRYIEANPVKAHLVAARKEWPWSSARFRDDYERLCLPD